MEIAPPRAPLSKFDSNATYVIGGGSGGIGRAIALWLASNGAKHILILARSGTASPAMQSLLTDLVARGIDIQAPSCDLSNAESVQNVLREVRDTMPPIKGVIQSTMVLREGILENLTSEDWHAALAPKVQGTWNLHTYLPRGLEFFVCLSSVAGITGCRSQASYNAACTYQDSLMRYRHTIGERGVSFDLGTVIGVGSAAATDKTAMLRREGYLGIRKTELLAMLDYCCSSETQISSPQQTQLVTGLSWMLQYKPSDQSKVYWTRNAICAVLRQMNSSVATAASDNKEVSAGELLAAAESEAEATNVALEALIGKLSRLFSIPTSDVDANMPILAIGIDSLVALEVRYWLMKELKADVPVSEINKDQALVDLARCAAGKSQYRTEGEV
jgi:NAD(P)-dependent dehydrogenase (short-subunit alcohol dehydrogenase family)